MLYLVSTVAAGTCTCSLLASESCSKAFRTSEVQTKQKEFVCCLFLLLSSGSSSGDWWNGQRRAEPHISKLEVAVPSSSAAAFGSSIATECLGWRLCRKRRCGRRMTSDGLMVFCIYLFYFVVIESVVLFDHRQTPRHNLPALTAIRRATIRVSEQIWQVRDSKMAVAWAKDNGHSAPLGLTWNVWNSNAKDFVSDANLMATQLH